MKAMQATSPELCTHSELLHLDATTGYTLASNAVVQLVVSTPEIATAVRLWFHIRYEQSGFLDRTFISRTVEKLADNLKVKRTTIQRWQKTLVTEGFLEVVYTKKIDGQNNPNRYRACLPKKLVSLIRSEVKARQKVSKESVKPEVDKPVEPENVIPKITNDSKPIESTNNKVYTVYTFRDSDVLLEQIKQEAKAPEWIVQALKVSPVQVKGDTATVLTTNTFVRDWLKQSGSFNHLLCSHFSNDELHIEIRLDTASPEKQIEKKVVQRRKQSVLPTDVCLGPKRAPMKGYTILRIKERLEAMRSFSATQIRSLVGEIIYSVTSGSLKAMPEQFALNAALKLVKENRWATPAGYSLV